MISIAARAIPVDVVSDEALTCLHDWIESGANAGMAYMANWPELRRDPEGLLPGARTMIALAIPFPLPAGGAPSGAIASYALGLDYHDLIRNLFRPALRKLTEKGMGEWRLCVDSAPVMERYWSVRSGLGRLTRSGMVSVDGFGTACFLFELLTTATPAQLGLMQNAPLTASDFAELFGIDAAVPDITLDDIKPSECTQCGRCEKACPAGALSGGYCEKTLITLETSGNYYGKVNARFCLSYLTIEHRGPFDTPEAARAMSTPAGRETLFGCDRCVTACPLNRLPYRNQENLRFLPGLLPVPAIASLTKQRCAEMTQEEFSRLFKDSPIKRAKLEGLRRNANSLPLYPGIKQPSDDQNDWP